MDTIINIINQITTFLGSLNATVYVVLTFVVEAILRLVKTDKPKSLLLAIAVICEKLSAMFLAISNVLNKIIPQNTKAE